MKMQENVFLLHFLVQCICIFCVNAFSYALVSSDRNSLSLLTQGINIETFFVKE